MSCINRIDCNNSYLLYCEKGYKKYNVFIFYGVLFFEGDFCIMIKQAL